MINEAILHDERGGYNKADVLAKTDAYNVLLIALDEMRLSDSAVNVELEKIRSMPMRRTKGFILSAKGFSVKETDDYIAKLEQEIRSKIML